MNLKNIFKFKNNIWIRTFLIALISTLLAGLIKHELLSVSDYMTHTNAADFKTSDLYSSSLHRSPVHRISRDVVIVSVDNCERSTIYQCINKILSYSPAVVAMDIIFEFSHPSDTLLLPIINDKRLVFANYLLDIDSEANATNIETSYFHDLLYNNTGTINVEESSVVREFQPLYTLQGNKTFNCFAGEVVKLYSPDKLVTLLTERGVQPTPISYHKVDFDSISSGHLLADTNNLELFFKDKIVLIGALHDPSDIFVTPIDRGYPGVLVHASIIDTILNKNYIKEISPIYYYIISFLCCICFLLLFFYIKEYIDELSVVVMRIAQIAILIFLYQIGVRLYDNNIYMNCLLPMLTITFSTVVSDIYLGLEHVVLKYGKIWTERLKGLL